MGDIPNHSIVLVTYPNGEVVFTDMSNGPSFNMALTNEMIKGTNKDGTPITVENIIKYSGDETRTLLSFNIHDDAHQKLIDSFDLRRRKIDVLKPEQGHIAQTLGNLGIILSNYDLIPEALEVEKRAIAIGLDSSGMRVNLAISLLNAIPGSELEVIGELHKAIMLDPECLSAYLVLIHVLKRLGRKEEAIVTYKKIIELADPEKDKDLLKATETVLEGYI